MAIPRIKLKKGEALVLRTSDRDGKSYNDFMWPKKGKVEAPDWKPTATCGNGLHGLLHGVGSRSYLNWEDAAWIVVKVIESECIWIDGNKVKFPRGEVVYFGDRFEAVALITEHAPAGSVIVCGTATAGYCGCISILYWNGKNYKRAVFLVGENGIKPNKPYQVDETGKPIEVKKK